MRRKWYLGVSWVTFGFLLSVLFGGVGAQVAGANEVIVEDFEDLSDWDISGSFPFTFETSESQAKEGRFSGKLEYDVKQGWSKLVMKPKRTLRFTHKLENIRFWLYAPVWHSDLKVFFIFSDSSGEKHTYYFTPSYETKLSWVEFNRKIEPLKGKAGGSGSEIKGGDGNKILNEPWTLKQIEIIFRKVRKDIVYFDNLAFGDKKVTLSGEAKNEKRAEDKPVIIDESKIPGPLQSAEPGNLVANSSFEDGIESGALPQGWQLRTWEGKSLTVKVDVDQKIKHSGSASLKLSSDDIGAMGGISQKLKVKPNRGYYFAAWVKTEGMETRTTEAVTAGFDIGGKKTFINMGVRGKNVDVDWRIYVSQIEVPPGVEKVELILILYNARGTAWIDDVWFGDSSLGWEKLKGAVYVQTKGNLTIAEEELSKILSKRGGKDERYDEAGETIRTKICRKVKLPPLKEIDTPLAIATVGGDLPWRKEYIYRPGSVKAMGTGGIEPLRLKMKRGQTQVQASLPRGTARFWTNIAELQGKPDIDTKVRNATTGEEYVYKSNPDKRTEYTVNMKIGKFTFGKAQRESDMLEFSYKYWRYSYRDLERKLTDEQLMDVFMDEAADLYCKKVRMSLSGWPSWEHLMKYMDELEERGMRVGDMHVGIEASRGNIFGEEYAKVPVSAVIPYVKKLRGRVDQYVIWYGPRKGAYPALPPEECVKRLRPVVQAFREADPEVKIIGPHSDAFPVMYIKKALDAGLAEIVDGVSMNTYASMSFYDHPELPDRIEDRNLRRIPNSDFSWEGLEPMLHNYLPPLDIHAFEKQIKCYKDMLDKYKKGMWMTVCEWGFDFGYPGCWAKNELSAIFPGFWDKNQLPAIFPAVPPEPTEDRRQYAEALEMPDIPSRQGRYNSGIMTGREAIIWSDLYAELGINGTIDYQGLQEIWHYGLPLINQWGKKRLKYYAYQTVNKLLYNPKELERPRHINTLPEHMHTHIYLRDNDELIVILWTPLREALVDVVIDDKDFAYPVRIDFFDYDNLMPLDSEVIGGQRIVRNVPVSPEPFIIRLVRP